MESSFQKLSIQNSAPLQKKKLASNVYKVKTEDTCVVYKYDVKVERIVIIKGQKKIFPIVSFGPDAYRIIRTRVTKAALLPISRMDRYKDTTVLYDGHDFLYANKSLTDSSVTEEISIASMNLLDEDRRIILQDATSILITLKIVQELRNIQASINECDREEINMIKFYSSLVKSAAPEDRYICLRGGRLFDKTQFKELPRTGMERAKGIKMGTKLIGNEQLSVSFDIDSKEGTFFKAQSLMKSIAAYFKCSVEEVEKEYRNCNLMRKMDRYIRDMVVREEGTDRVFTIAGLKWGENGDGMKYLIALSDVCPEKVKSYGEVPVVVEENVNKEGKFIYKHYPLNSLHVLPCSKVPLAKQDKENRPPALAPAERYRLINKAREDIRIDHQNENLKAFQTQIATEPVHPTSEILAAPSIYGVKNGQTTRINVDSIKHSYNSNPYLFMEPARISHFTIIYDKTEFRDERTIRQFCEALFGVCRLKGMNGPIPNYRGVSQPNELNNELKSLASIRDEGKKNGISPISFVLCFGFRDYHDFLKYAEHEFKVICQHVMQRTVEKVNRLSREKLDKDFTLHNIVKKINEKCGGTNLEVMGPTECASVFPQRVTSKSPASLVFGMDVCHGDPLSRHLERRGIKPDPSIIGISSNALTKNLQRFTGDFIATQGRREAVPDTVMSDHGRFLTQKFFENHNRLPDNVILVRDGVARSQYEMALGEFDALMDGVRSFASQKPSTSFNPREILIITTKEHNLRLFDRVGGKVCNPKPGTVVDTDIVSPFHPEFFLIPHDAFHGTAVGVLVTILRDGEKDLKKYSRESLNEMKQFIHTTSFLHGISDLPQSLPEPVTVAHDLAERGFNISKEMRYRYDYRPSVEELNNKLSTRGTALEGCKFTA